jgi:hypothetical protein
VSGFTQAFIIFGDFFEFVGVKRPDAERKIHGTPASIAGAPANTPDPTAKRVVDPGWNAPHRLSQARW